MEIVVVVREGVDKNKVKDKDVIIQTMNIINHEKLFLI